MDRIVDRVLIITVVGEALTGLLLLFVPDFVAGLLLGMDLADAGLSVARVAGIALVALSVACWPGPASLGMLVYSLLVTVFLAWLGATQTTTGALLWPAVFVHAVLAALLVIHVKQGHRREVRK